MDIATKYFLTAIGLITISWLVYYEMYVAPELESEELYWKEKNSKSNYY